MIALTPQGRQLDQALVEELAGEPALAVLSSRFEGFDARIVDHLCTDAISIGPYVLSGGELPAMVLVDAIARRLPGRTRRRLRRERELQRRARRRHRVSALHTPRRVPGLGGSRRASLGQPRQHRQLAGRAEPIQCVGARRASARTADGARDLGTPAEPPARPWRPAAPPGPERPRRPVDRSDARWPLPPRPLPRAGRCRRSSPAAVAVRRYGRRERVRRGARPYHRCPLRLASPGRHSRNPSIAHARPPERLRVTIDWVVTIVGAVAIVLLVKAFVVNPYRIPSSSMEPTLHCSQPAVGCEARFSDRVLANRFLYQLPRPAAGRDHRLQDAAGRAGSSAAPAARSSSA